MIGSIWSIQINARRRILGCARSLTKSDVRFRILSHRRLGRYRREDNVALEATLMILQTDGISVRAILGFLIQRLQVAESEYDTDDDENPHRFTPTVQSPVSCGR